MFVGVLHEVRPIVVKDGHPVTGIWPPTFRDLCKYELIGSFK